MKTLSLTVKSILALSFICATAACSEKPAETQTPAQASSTEAQTPALNIRFVDADSVMSAYKLAQELNEEGQKLMNNAQRQAQAKQNEIQQLGASIEQKRQNNVYLTEASFQADVEKFQNKQNEAARFLQQQELRIQNTIAESQTRLTDSLLNYVKDYNAIHHYDAILLKSSGLLFNPDLDITAEIIEGLNARYNSVEAK